MFGLLNGAVPAVKSSYPHLMPEDAELWRRFCGNGQYLPDEVWYDVKVGAPVFVAADQPDYLVKFAMASTRKRIDIVWRIGSNYWVVECKPRAGLMALGQAIYYTYAFGKEVKHYGNVISAVITDTCDEDLRPLFDLVGVVVFEVGRKNGI